MHRQFTKHYTRQGARALLPAVRGWLDQLSDLRRELTRAARDVAGIMSERQDAGGTTVNNFVRALVESRSLFGKFQEHEIQIKDLERGLVDFPAIMDDREVFLCWEKSEDDIEFWHDLDSGYSGREAL
jgi:hypothetical protein